MHPEDEECYGREAVDDIYRWSHFNLGNCKKCIHKSSCGNKNKREADGCDKYRPEMKRRRKR
jgi:hypothetical protein